MKSYKIVRIAGVSSQGVCNSFYFNNPKLKNAPYSEQLQALFANALMYSDTFSRELRKLGHWAEDLVYDLEPLQKSWARENNIQIQQDKWQHEIIFAQLAKIQPDVVFFQDIHSLPYELRAKLKEQIPSIKKLVIFRGYPGVDKKLIKELSLADLILVGSPILLNVCRLHNLQAHLVYHSFDPIILEKLPPLAPKEMIDFSFVGSSGYGYGTGHQDRYWMLLSLLQKTDIALWIDEPENTQSIKKRFRTQMVNLIKSGLACCNLNILNKLNNSSKVPTKFKKLIAEEIDRNRYPKNDLLPKIPLRKIFPNRCHQPLFGINMFKQLQQSKVVLNKHSNPAEGTVDNIRMFQATGVGTCLLTDNGTNLPDLFEVDREVVTYSSTEECIEKVRYLLEHDFVRQQISKAGQTRTLRDHNSAKRYAQIDSLIQEIL